MIEPCGLAFFCGSKLLKVNFSINGNDWAIWRKNSYSNARSSCNDIWRTDLNNPPGKLFVMLF